MADFGLGLDRLDSQLLNDLSMLEDPNGGNLLDFHAMLEGIMSEEDELQEELEHQRQAQDPAQNQHMQGQRSDDLVPSTSGEAGSSGMPAATSGARARGRRASANGGVGDQGLKKRRTRNAQQMEMNRVAQAKYRERKKAEQEELQQAVDKLAAQVAAFKVLEIKAQHLEHHNKSLQNTVAEQNVAIAGLQQQVTSQGAELSSTRTALAQNQELVGRQQTMILDQHSRIELQNQVIASLKEQLRDKIDEAMKCVQPGSVCDQLVGAVKAAMYGAKNMEGLQEQLDKLPAELTTEICRNIFCVVKDTFPELKARCHELAKQGAFAGCPYS